MCTTGHADQATAPRYCERPVTRTEATARGYLYVNGCEESKNAEKQVSKTSRLQRKMIDILAQNGAIDDAIENETAFGTDFKPFAKKLAHTEKTVRDKNFSLLRRWLISRVDLVIEKEGLEVEEHRGKGTKQEKLRKLSSDKTVVSEVNAEATQEEEESESEAIEDEIFSDADAMKLWKGLFYCMWMSDTMPIQQELAKKMAKLTQVFSPLNSTGQMRGNLTTVQRKRLYRLNFRFVSTFFVSMAREWSGLDRLRLDKFYSLIRKLFYEYLWFTLSALRLEAQVVMKGQRQRQRQRTKTKEKVDDDDLFSGVRDVYDEYDRMMTLVLSLRANGVRFHIVDIFMTEFTRVRKQFLTSEGSAEEKTALIDWKALQTLLRPFYEAICSQKSGTLFTAIMKATFLQFPSFQRDLALDKSFYHAVTKSIFNIAADCKTMHNTRRKDLYEIYELLKSLPIWSEGEELEGAAELSTEFVFHPEQAISTASLTQLKLLEHLTLNGTGKKQPVASTNEKQPSKKKQPVASTSEEQLSKKKKKKRKLPSQLSSSSATSQKDDQNGLVEGSTTSESQQQPKKRKRVVFSNKIRIRKLKRKGPIKVQASREAGKVHHVGRLKQSGKGSLAATSADVPLQMIKKASLLSRNSLRKALMRAKKNTMKNQFETTGTGALNQEASIKAKGDCLGVRQWMN